MPYYTTTSNTTFDGSTDVNPLGSHYNISPSQKPNIHLDTIIPNQSATDVLGNQSMNMGNDSDNISSMLQGFSLGLNSSQQDLMTTTYSLRISNLPDDFTLREAFLIFGLAENVLSIELINDENASSNGNRNQHLSIMAKFDVLPLVVRYANILNNKIDLFGPNSTIKSHIEVIEDASQKQIPFTSMDTSFSTFQNQGGLLQQQQQQNQQSQSQQQQLQQNMIGASLTSNKGSSANRGSLLPQLSRFSFSDPFSVEASPREAAVLKSKSSSVSHPPTHHPEINPNTRDAGKSFLLMENDEINDNIWGTNSLAAGINAFSSTPQPSTPTVAWGSTSNNNNANHNNSNNNANNRRQSSAFYLPNVAGSTGVNQQSAMPNMDLNQPIPINNISNSLSASTASMQAYNGMLNQIGAPQNMMVNEQAYNQQPTPQQQQQQQQQQLSGLQNTTPIKSKVPSNLNRNLPGHSVTPTQPMTGGMVDNKNINKLNSSSTISLSSVTGTATMSEADLSLLAKVPPPANPADQNPPCNTLYVGNLPPDATEQELRQLFSGQEGFRRLSFRNKNGNGNGHGPMCFVEFEDVSFATRALAELYGRKLPRTTTNNKGGIRLSFSKNPLGVRGPNSKRNMNSNTNSNSTGNMNSLPNGGHRPGSANLISNTNLNYSYTTYTKNP